MLIQACGWYTLVMNTVVVLSNLFGNDKPLRRLVITLFQIPIVYFVIMSMFGK